MLFGASWLAPRTPLRNDTATVRAWHERDVPTIVAAGSDAEIVRLTTVLPYGDEDDARLFLEREEESTRDGRALSLAIADAPEAPALGGILLHRLDRERAQGEIAYWVLPSARGRGLATDGVRLVVAHAFRTLGLRRVELLVEPDNVASIRVAERAGFRREPGERQRLDNTGTPMVLLAFARHAQPGAELVEARSEEAAS